MQNYEQSIHPNFIMQNYEQSIHPNFIHFKRER
jgi:hypothetical protein